MNFVFQHFISEKSYATVKIVSDGSRKIYINTSVCVI